MRRLVAALVFLAFPLVCPAAGNSGDETDPTLERATFVLINQYRISEHLAPLNWSPEIAKVARAHSRDMAAGAVSFGHAGFSDRISQLRETVSGLIGCGENVLETSSPNDLARSAVALWVSSAPHRENIRGKYDLSGIGIWHRAAGAYYFTEIFVRVARTSSSEGDAL